MCQKQLNKDFTIVFNWTQIAALHDLQRDYPFSMHSAYGLVYMITDPLRKVSRFVAMAEHIMYHVK